MYEFHFRIVEGNIKKYFCALAWRLSWLEHCPVHQKGGGFDP